MPSSSPFYQLLGLSHSLFDMYSQIITMLRLNSTPHHPSHSLLSKCSPTQRSDRKERERVSENAHFYTIRSKSQLQQQSAPLFLALSLTVRSALNSSRERERKKRDLSSRKHLIPYLPSSPNPVNATTILFFSGD